MMASTLLCLIHLGGSTGIEGRTRTLGSGGVSIGLFKTQADKFEDAGMLGGRLYLEGNGVQAEVYWKGMEIEEGQMLI